MSISVTRSGLRCARHSIANRRSTRLRPRPERSERGGEHDDSPRTQSLRRPEPPKRPSLIRAPPDSDHALKPPAKVDLARDDSARHRTSSLVEHEGASGPSRRGVLDTMAKHRRTIRETSDDGAMRSVSQRAGARFAADTLGATPSRSVGANKSKHVRSSQRASHRRRVRHGALDEPIDELQRKEHRPLANGSRAAHGAHEAHARHEKAGPAQLIDLDKRWSNGNRPARDEERCASSNAGRRLSARCARARGQESSAPRASRTSPRGPRPRRPRWRDGCTRRRACRRGCHAPSSCRRARPRRRSRRS